MFYFQWITFVLLQQTCDDTTWWEQFTVDQRCIPPIKYSLIQSRITISFAFLNEIYPWCLSTALIRIMNMEMNDLYRTREHELRDTDHWKLEMFWVFSASEGLLEGRLWRTGTSVLLMVQSQPSVRDCFKESLLTMTDEADGISWCAKRPNWRRRWKTKTRPRPWTSVRFNSSDFQR